MTTRAPVLVTAEAFASAIAALDLPRAAGLVTPDVDFRAMTPRRIWEADGPAGVEEVLRAWLADPDEQVEQVTTTAPALVENTARVGWLVHRLDPGGPCAFEQQAYVRERGGRIGWLRIMCSGPVPRGGA